MASSLLMLVGTATPAGLCSCAIGAEVRHGRVDLLTGLGLGKSIRNLLRMRGGVIVYLRKTASQIEVGAGLRISRQTDEPEPSRCMLEERVDQRRANPAPPRGRGYVHAPQSPGIGR